MKKFLKKFRVTDINVFVYRRATIQDYDLPNFKYKLESYRENSKWRYIIKDKDKIIHRSYIYDAVFLLKVIQKKGPVIGDCITNKEYRGQSIYPYVINRITNEAIKSGEKEIFIIVNQDNISSIKGIEKASFIKFASIKAKRWLWIYRDKQITNFNT